MSTKIIFIWLILLTAWVVWSGYSEYENLQLRKSNTMYRNQKFKDIDANLEYLDSSLKSLEKYVNGPLRDGLNELGKYSHKH